MTGVFFSSFRSWVVVKLLHQLVTAPLACEKAPPI